MEIVYCGGCGKALREDDFARGLAHFLDNRPWCSECKPPDKAPIPALAPSAPRKMGSTAKIPRVVLPPPEPGSSSRALWIGLGTAGVVVVTLIAFMSSGSSRPPTPSPDPSPRPPVRPAVDTAEPERLLRELEAFASLSPPDKVLSRCEEMRSRLKGTPQEKRFAEIEAAARDQKKSRDDEVQLGRELDALRKIVEDDVRFEKYDEVVRRLTALRPIAGARGPEVERRMKAYQTARRESPHEKHAGPFEPDEGGFIRNWLFLGPFPFEQEKGLDTDYLQGEDVHDPRPGMEAGKLKWTAAAAAESKIDLYKIAPLALKFPAENVVVYAACLLQVSEEATVEVRLCTDDGGKAWIDGKPVYKFHGNRSVTADAAKFGVTLTPGLHRVLMKIENHKNNYGFILRVVTPDGRRVPLRVWN